MPEPIEIGVVFTVDPTFSDPEKVRKAFTQYLNVMLEIPQESDEAAPYLIKGVRYAVPQEPEGTTAEALIPLLAAAGIESSSPAHGALFITVDDTHQLTTGYSGWHYAGIDKLVDSEWQPDEDGAYQLEDFCDEADENDPAKVAAGIIRVVQKLRGTPQADYRHHPEMSQRDADDASDRAADAAQWESDNADRDEP